MSSLTDQELDDLTSFLSSEATPEECMDISMLDGFFTALAFCPERLQPEEWLEEVWGDDEGPEFADEDEADYVIDLLIRYQESVEATLEEAEGRIEPLFYEHSEGGRTYFIPDEWCVGFLAGVDLNAELWERLAAKGQADLLAPIEMFGTEEGWEALEAAPDPLRAQEEWAARIQENLPEIFRFWRANGCH